MNRGFHYVKIGIANLCDICSLEHRESAPREPHGNPLPGVAYFRLVLRLGRIQCSQVAEIAATVHLKIVGRPFSKELLGLQATLKHAHKLNVTPVEEFISKSGDSPIYTVGVGGSFTAAILAARLGNHRGRFSQAKTTFGFISDCSNLTGASVILFTGRGNNRDIIAAFDHAIGFEAKAILIICASKNSRIAKRATRYWDTTVFDFELPSGRDGFLATNTLLACCVVVARSFGQDTGGLSAKPECAGAFDKWVQRNKEEDRDTILVLHGGEGTPAAVDLESKSSEAALTNVILSDYRHFAHGRHVWLAKRANKSAVVAFVAPAQANIAHQTLQLLPSTVPVLRLSSPYNDARASIDLLLSVFYLVRSLGISAGTDPGRPNVPAFGRRVYHLNSRALKKNSSPQTQLKRAAIHRKSAVSVAPIDWEKSYDKFLAHLTKTRFAAIVFDFDGTLCGSRDRLRGVSNALEPHLVRLAKTGVKLGIATGRGKSAHYALREVFPKRLWAEVVIGFYNGGCISTLADSAPDLERPAPRLLQGIYERLHKQDALSYDLDLRPWQLSIKPRRGVDADRIANLLNETVALIGGSAELVYSSHSFDILAPEVSKLRVVEAFQRGLGEVLCIGDRGAWPGNDFRLLSTAFGLSADTVSVNAATCWNIAPSGVRCVQATCFYLAGLSGSSGFARYSLLRSLKWFQTGRHE